jgi:hypothetical protein
MTEKLAELFSENARTPAASRGSASFGRRLATAH